MPIFPECLLQLLLRQFKYFNFKKKFWGTQQDLNAFKTRKVMKVKEESEKVGLKLNIQKTKIIVSGLIISWEIDGKQWKQWQTLFFWAPKSLQMVIAAMKLKDAYSLEGKLLPTSIAYSKAETLLCQQRSV